MSVAVDVVKDIPSSSPLAVHLFLCLTIPQLIPATAGQYEIGGGGVIEGDWILKSQFLVRSLTKERQRGKEMEDVALTQVDSCVAEMVKRL